MGSISDTLFLLQVPDLHRRMHGYVSKQRVVDVLTLMRVDAVRGGLAECAGPVCTACTGERLFDSLRSRTRLKGGKESRVRRIKTRLSNVTGR